MAKITIEYDDAAGIKVDQSQATALSPSITDAEGGAAPGASSADDAPGPGRFDRLAADTVAAGGPPEWLFQSIGESLESVAPNAAPNPGDDAIDGGSAPEA
jgi:hypothetical protein